jgi:hypothetical protein
MVEQTHVGQGKVDPPKLKQDEKQETSHTGNQSEKKLGGESTVAYNKDGDFDSKYF